MSKIVVKVEHKPVLGPEETVYTSVMRARLQALPIKWTRIKLTDSWFYVPGWDGWRKAIDYLLPKIPKYYADKFDCENCAGWFRHMMAGEFKINTFAEVEGYADMEDGRGPQRHGWNVFTDGFYFFQMESQNCVIMDIDDKRYIPDEITMG